MPRCVLTDEWDRTCLHRRSTVCLSLSYVILSGNVFQEARLQRQKMPSLKHSDRFGHYRRFRDGSTAPSAALDGKPCGQVGEALVPEPPYGNP